MISSAWIVCILTLVIAHDAHCRWPSPKTWINQLLKHIQKQTIPNFHFKAKKQTWVKPTCVFNIVLGTLFYRFHKIEKHRKPIYQKINLTVFPLHDLVTFWKNETFECSTNSHALPSSFFISHTVYLTTHVLSDSHYCHYFYCHVQTSYLHLNSKNLSFIQCTFLPFKFSFLGPLLLFTAPSVRT